MNRYTTYKNTSYDIKIIKCMGRVKIYSFKTQSNLYSYQLQKDFYTRKTRGNHKAKAYSRYKDNERGI